MRALRVFPKFMAEVFAPGLHAVFAAAWFFGLFGSLTVAARSTGWPAAGLWLKMGAVILANFCVLFYLRVLDEIKDYDYDRVHNPTRPLVRRWVSQRDLWHYSIALGGVALCMSGLISSWLLTIIAADLLYGAWLVWIERVFPRFGDWMLVNLAFTYPVNLALSVHIIVFFYFFGVPRGTVIHFNDVLLIFMGYFFSFLHYEFARKTSWPQDATPGKRLYSGILGTRGSALLAFLFACLAVLFVIAGWRPWELPFPANTIHSLPIFALIPPVHALPSFMTGKKRSLAGSGMSFLVLFYSTGIIVWVIGRWI